MPPPKPRLRTVPRPELFLGALALAAGLDLVIEGLGLDIPRGWLTLLPELLALGALLALVPPELLPTLRVLAPPRPAEALRPFLLSAGSVNRATNAKIKTTIRNLIEFLKPDMIVLLSRPWKHVPRTE
ncbi:MAG: hypothetical protein ACYS18_01720 [Planctomycetota bacterium]